MRLNRRLYDAHRRLRRSHVGLANVGPAWTILCSEVLAAACDLAEIEPARVITQFPRNRPSPDLGNRTEAFTKLRKQIPHCTFIRVRSGIVQIRAGATFSYFEDQSIPRLAIYAYSLPETVLKAVRGERLSQLVDVSAMPALAAVDPVIKRIANVCHAPTGTDHRVIIDLEVDWLTAALVPDFIAAREGWAAQSDARTAPWAD